ncbi:hypothetical protein AC1031_015103 [Aphanomyces cochlioides]|nr:hypothetical protein AC1031_015103 [Aphanomyces cochlioides]
MKFIHDVLQTWLNTYGAGRLPKLIAASRVFQLVLTLYAVYFGHLDLAAKLHAAVNLCSFHDPLVSLAALSGHLNGYYLRGQFHPCSPTDPQCQGVGVTGECCERTWGLNSVKYCHTHVDQGPLVKDPPSWEVIDRCQGIAKRTTQQCRKDWEILENGYCIYHQDRAPIFRRL